jgi:hypothetical protein
LTLLSTRQLRTHYNRLPSSPVPLLLRFYELTMAIRFYELTSGDEILIAVTKAKRELKRLDPAKK